MKAFNILFKTSLVAVIIVAFTSGCDNLTNPEPISAIDTTKTATIQGSAEAVYDLTTGESEPAPQGTTVKFVLDSEQFVNNIVPGHNYQSLTYTTTLDGSGNYSIEVPALDEPTSVVIYLDSFSATQVQGDGSEEERTFTTGSINLTVVAGLTTVAPDANYTAN